MHTSFDVAIIGGGIVGIATAAELVQRHPKIAVVVLEKEPALAAHQTGHNSGVIHSGLYYKPGSAKAKTCVRGSARMRRYCQERGLPIAIVGKVVVAVDESEIPRLDELQRRGTANGVDGLRRISAAELQTIEPHARGREALHVPNAAIVDYTAVTVALADDVTAAGGMVRTGAEVRDIVREAGAWRLLVTDGEVRARVLLTCGGLWSDRLAHRAEGKRPDVRIVPFRGEYHRLRPEREELVRGLIYPVPDPRFPFLGVHFTRMVGGGVECGPNAVLAFRRDGYTKTAFSIRDSLGTATWPGFWRLAARHLSTGMGEMWRSLSKAAFARALQRLVPDVRTEDIAPIGAGVRAQALQRNGALVDDFLVILGESSLHVLNAPSPAATASMEIGREIVERCEAAGLLRSATMVSV
ncbi:MAG: L-2-hydroxyglutarate oxidase [Planctomycetota bacterium]